MNIYDCTPSVIVTNYTYMYSHSLFMDLWHSSLLAFVRVSGRGWALTSLFTGGWARTTWTPWGKM